MATCVFDDIAHQFEIGTGDKDEKKHNGISVSPETKENKLVAMAPAEKSKSSDINDFILAGIVVALVILSCAALVYAARH